MPIEFLHTETWRKKMIRLGISRRTTTLLTTSVALLCCIPQEGISFEASKNATELLDASEMCNGDFFLNQILQIENQLEEVDDIFSESKAFLKAFVEEINFRYGSSLTVFQACELAKNNLDLLQISEKDCERILEVMNCYQASCPGERVLNSLKWKLFYKVEKKNGKFEYKIDKGVLIFGLLCLAGVTVAVLNPPSGVAIIESLSSVAPLLITE